MSQNIKNNSAFQQLHFYLRKLMRLFNVKLPSKRLLFKPSSQTPLHDGYNNNLPFDEKHYHRPNTRPSADKQTHLKEKQRTKKLN